MTEDLEPADDYWRELLPIVRSFVRRRLGPKLSRLESPTDIMQSACRELLAELRDTGEQPDPAHLRWRLLRRSLRKVIGKHRYYEAGKRDVKRQQALPSGLVTKDAGPLGQVLAAEAAQRLESALARLRPVHRQVLEWHTRDGLPHAVIAARLEITVDASKMLLLRARARLAEELDQPGPD